MTTASTVTRQHTVIDSPYGDLTLVATDGVLSGLYMTGQRHRPAEETFGVPDPGPFLEAARQLDAYFAGGLTEFDLPLRLEGTPSSAASGPSSYGSRTARPAPTANWPTASGSPAPPVRWAWRTAGTRWGSSSPATASSEPRGA